MRKLVLLLSVLALATFGFAACGGDDDEGEDGPPAAGKPAGDKGGKPVAVSAVPDGSFAFEQESLDAPTGAVSFEFENPATLGHDFCVEDEAGEELGCTEVISEDSDTLDVDLEAGEYTFYCSVAGHREGGMEGTLTVK